MHSIQRGILPAMATVVLLTAIGCAPERVYFGDTIDLDFDFNPVANNQEKMHQPYVRGSEFSISVQSRWLDEDMTGWTVEVGDSSILSISDIDVYESREPSIPEMMTMHAVALAEGSTTLEIYGKSGQFITATPIEVAVPDNARLKPNGPLCIHDESLIVDEDSFQVLEDGMSTYEVEFYRGSERLYGNATLEASSEDDIAIQVERTYLWEDRDWLQVTPLALGDHEVTLFSDGESVDTVVFEAVTAEDVGHMVLHGQSEVGIEEEQWLAVLAQSYDFVGRPIYGVEFHWTLDGAEEEGLGDLYRYEYDPRETNVIEAVFLGLSDQLQIHGEGYVDSSNDLGCAVGGAGSGASAGATAALAALLGLLGVLRVRRVR